MVKGSHTGQGFNTWKFESEDFEWIKGILDGPTPLYYVWTATGCARMPLVLLSVVIGLHTAFAGKIELSNQPQYSALASCAMM
jgi:hypothetical protein